MSTWDYSALWEESFKVLRERLSENEITMWLSNTGYHSSAESELTIAVPSRFIEDQIRQRYHAVIEDILFELMGMPIKLAYAVERVETPTASKISAVPAAQTIQNPVEQPKTSSTPSVSNPAHTEDAPRENTPASAGPSQTSSTTIYKAPAAHENHRMAQKPRALNAPNLTAEYTFDNYVIGNNNAFATNAAMAIAKNPGNAYNPCLIYGGVGLGKTHLLQSIGHEVFNNDPSAKIVYVTAENFTNEFIAAIRENKTHKFKNKYRYADVLLVDDIHFFNKKQETQEELFHTFNALYDAKKQMVFTCDRPVTELKELTDRLKNRFERGLNVDLQPPSFETRSAILKRKVESSGVNIPDEVVDLISKNVTSNVRDLEAALTKLIAYAELVHRDITIDIAEQQLKDVFSNPRQNNVTFDVIMKVVAEYFNLSQSDIRGKRRTKAIVFPRQIVMYLTRELTEYSTTEIGSELGGRDHTTIMHGCDRIENRMKTDPTLEPTIQHLIRTIKNNASKSN